MDSDHMMWSYRLGAFGQPLAAHRHEIPLPNGSEVLVKVSGVGVCHSDVHICEGHYDLGEGRKSSFAGHLQLPLTLGHEIAGSAFMLGPNAKNVVIGENYLVCPWIGCGSCRECRDNAEHMCRAPRFLGANRDGGFAEYVLVPDANYLVALGDLDPVRAAPLACSGLTTFSALKKFGTALKLDPVVIVGAGGLGLMALGIIGLLGGKGAIVVERDAGRREAALAAGALAVIDPADPQASKRARSAAGGEVFSVLDLVGSGETLTFGFNLLGRRGRLIVVGLLGGSATLPVPMFPMKGAIIEGSYIGNLAELKELVAMIRTNGMAQVPIDQRPLARANSALRDLTCGRIVGRVVLTP